MKRNWKFGTAMLALSGMGLLNAAKADEPVAPPQRQPDATRREVPPGQEGARQRGSLDQHFAACLILGNQNEVAGAKLAQGRSKSPEVKKFAEMLEKDHQQFISELEKVGGERFRGRKVGSSAGSGDARVEGARPVQVIEQEQARARPVRPGTEAAAGGDPLQVFLQIKQEVADECLASMQRELSGKDGKEFDACYVGMQLAAHMHMIDELKVLERHASPEFQGLLRKGRETAQKHLEQGKVIMKDIEKNETKTAASK